MSIDFKSSKRFDLPPLPLLKETPYRRCFLFLCLLREMWRKDSLLKYELRLSGAEISAMRVILYAISNMDGQGTLRYYSEPTYMPNDLYQLPATQFRLYYTSQSTVSQSFDIWISDNFGNEKQISFQFNNKD